MNNHESRLAAVEAGLVEQEHRPLRILRNFFILRPKLKRDDGRVDASMHALLWGVLRGMTPASPFFASAVGIIAIVVSCLNLFSLEKQNEIITTQRELEAHSLLIQHNGRLLELMVQYPGQRAYFYNNDPLPLEGDERLRALTLAEMWTDLFEQVLIQRANLPKTMEATWTQYAKDMYESSTAIQAYFAEAKDWYLPSLRELWLESK